MYALINISGLSIAIACCIILGLWLRSELTYDQHHKRHKEIYRVVAEFNLSGKIDAFAITSVALGPMLAADFPEIKGYVRLLGAPDREDLIRANDKAFYWKSVFICDANIFDVFTHDIIYGDPETALVEPNTAAVSETFSKKYFGDANPIGKTISNDGGTYTINLVFADLPENSHTKYDVLISFAKFSLPENETFRRQVLWGVSAHTYLLMPENYDPSRFESISSTFFEHHMADMAKSMNTTWRCWLQPLADIHFESDVQADMSTGNKVYMYGFMTVAFLILAVACINYMNLATARAARRAKEVGIRKILGVDRSRLVLQFLGESVFFSLIALFVGLVLVEIALNLPQANNLLGKNLDLNLVGEFWFPIWIILFGIGVGLISGSYPAFYLSSILPLQSLVTGLRVGRGRMRFRQLLVLVQFFITVSVIACTLIMALQRRYMSNKSLGFKKENRVIIRLKGADVYEKLSTIRKELAQNDHILGVSVSSAMIGRPMAVTLAKIENNDKVLEETSLKWMQVGNDFIDVMGMQLSKGRDFSKRLLTDVGTSFVVNEILAKKMGWAEPLGKQIQIGVYSGRVIGVVKDFHFATLHSPLEPFAMFIMDIDTSQINMESRPFVQAFLVVNISGDNLSRALSFLEEKFAEFDPKHPFRFEFLDDSLNNLYLPEQRLIKLIGIFAGVCIFISCLGLFGLASFTTEQRTKEIGIRKVLGASVWQIIFLLFRNTLWLVLVSAVIASLAAYFAMDEWLAGFAYRRDIDIWVFLVSTALAAFVAFVTVALQAYKPARMNPVNALRHE
jgi:putative ABC transport system permease protein